jgi:hypothetical protein
MSERRYLPFYLLFLTLIAMACGPLPGGLFSGGDPAAEEGPTPVASPTLAPTATPDPDATAVAVVTAPTLASTRLAESDGQSGSSGGTSGTSGGSQSGSSNGGSDGGQGSTSPGPAACPAGGNNLLENPSFEGQYAPFGYAEVNHAPGWFPWWQDDGQVNLRPEYKPADGALFPNRVHSGSVAQQYFKSFGMFKAGLMQVVDGVAKGSRLQFSAYGQAWSCEDFGSCPNATSLNPANMLMRVGIDPTGGTDWSSFAIQWGPYFNPLDQWQVACVEAYAEATSVSVFLWASPDKPNQNQDVYWDDAKLVVLP